MLNVSNAAPTTHPVLVIRLTSRSSRSCPYTETLKDHGLNLIECFTLEAAQQALDNGCRVGLLIVTQESELAHLDTCEPFVSNNRISWVGLVAQELVSMPRMREFIGEHLFNFITLPAELDHIVLTLRHAWGMAFMRAVKRNTVPAPVPDNADFVMVGHTSQMQQLFSQLHKVARTNASVLITGPSGTGKELAALSIHRQSARRNAPFVAVNCGAIAPQLFQSELFGYEKGAFTGANQRKIGRLEAAQGGTLFLDEIGDMPFDMQVNLLRFLQEKTIERVGGNDSVEIDVRVIAATHIDLAEAVRQGRFREDLYYRINVVRVEVPALRERGNDVLLLAQYFLERAAQRSRKSVSRLGQLVAERLINYDWPGNVRELENCMERAVALARFNEITLDDLPAKIRNHRPSEIYALSEDPQQLPTIQEVEERYIRKVLAAVAGNKTLAAKILGLDRRTLYRKLGKKE